METMHATQEGPMVRSASELKTTHLGTQRPNGKSPSAMTMMLVFALSLLVPLVPLSQAQEKAKQAAGDKAPVTKNAASDFIGEFESKSLRITLKESGGQFVGSIVAGKSKSDITAKLDGNTLTGVFKNAKVTNQFSATVEGSVLTFTTGPRSYQLNRIFTTAVFAGTFVGEDEAITIDADNDVVTGTLKISDSTYSFTAKLEKTTLKATYTHRGVKNEFTANVKGDLLTVNTGIESFDLKRSKSAAPVNFFNTARRTKLIASNKFIIDSTVLVSPDNNRVAYVIDPDGRRKVVINGKETPSEYRAGGFLFSPDSHHVVYLNKRNSKWHFTLDGAESEAYDDFGIGSNLFSPDSKRWAYAARIGEHFYVVDNKGKSKPYNQVSGIGFSPDSQRLAFLGERDGKWHIVIEGMETPIKATIEYGRILFSADSKRIAYVIAKDSMQHLVIDGKTSKPYEAINGVFISPDSKRVVLITTEGVNKRVVVDGVAGESFLAIGDIRFSPDGKTITYPAKQDGKWQLVVNGKKEQAYDGVAPPVFSKDGKHFAYAVLNEKEMFVILDGTPGPKFHKIGQLKLSPVGGRLAYLVLLPNGKWQVVIDGTAGRVYDKQPIGFAFGPSGKHYAFAATRAGKDYVVVDGIEDKPVWNLLKGGRPRFDGPKMLHTIVRRGDDFLRLEIDIIK